MTRAKIAAGGVAALIALIGVAVGYRALERSARPDGAASRSITLAATDTHPAPETQHGFLYGRITTKGGDTYEGRLRWGGDEEAFWGDYFNASKNGNRWVAHVPPGRLPRERRPIEIFGVVIAHREREIDLGRPFMARLGDIARIEARGRELRVTLKSGTLLDLDRFGADDLADGVRVWDAARGVVDLDEWRIRTIELLPTPPLEEVPSRLYGTVRTRQGEFTGFVQWDRKRCVGTDELLGRTPDGALRVRFDGIRSIERDSGEGARVTLLDGREVVLSKLAHGNRGIDVQDRRYGRVSIAWESFERVDFRPGGSGPAYGDFPPGRPLTGSVTTRSGRRLTGRLVYDLDESETTDTLDAPSRGVRYAIPFGRIASILPRGREEADARPALVTLHSGEELWLERSGDLAERNAGMLIFVDGRERPDYLPWTDVEHVRFDRPGDVDPTGVSGTR